MKRSGIYLIGCLAMITLAAGCSTKKNTASSRFYHSFTTRYNVYFNGNEAYKEGLRAIEAGNKDIYSEIIPLYPIGNKKTTGLGNANFDRTIEKAQKAIKLHSIKKKPGPKPGKRKDPRYKEWMARKEYNPFIYKAWMIMGKAQFYKGNFMEAVSTFSYITRLYYTNPSVIADARIWLARCYSEMDWFYDAEDILGKVNSDSLPKHLAPDYASAYANYLLKQKRYKEALPYLLTTIKNEKRSKQKAREYYLLGQIYQETGNNAKAYQSYEKAMKQSSSYELELNARIKQTEVISSVNTEKIISQLKRMTVESKNAGYLDQIYYAVGNIYLTKKDTINAVKEYRKGAEKSTRNGPEKGLILLKLGNIYWEQGNYVSAQPAYAEAIGSLGKEYPGYLLLNKRSEVLDELIAHVVNVQTQDSLQQLASLSEAERLHFVGNIIKEVKRKELEAQKGAEKQKLAEQREEMINAGAPNTNRQTIKTNTGIVSGDKSWYFYNMALVAQGKVDFQQKWGQRKLEDNWRRKDKTSNGTEDFAESKENAEESSPVNSGVKKDPVAASVLKDSVITDNKNPQFYLQHIPLTPEAMQESNDILSDGLYNMGLIYKDKLEDFSLAQKAFTRLYTRFPDFTKLDEVYYNLFLMNSRWKKPEEALLFKNKLIKEFPKSKYSITLSDPDYIYNALYGKQLEDSLYTQTYQYYQSGRYSDIETNYAIAAQKYPLGKHFPKFIYLHAMSVLQSGDKEKFQYILKDLIQKYPENEITELATNTMKGIQEGRLLAKGGNSLGSIWKLRKIDSSTEKAATDTLPPAFDKERNTPYLFILAYEEGKADENLLLYEMARYNFSNFMVRNFDLSFVKENGIGMLQVKEFTNFDEAYQYMKRLYADKTMAAKLSGMRTMVISYSNYELLKKYYSFDDYTTFYEKNFSVIPEPEIKGYTIDEPILNTDDLPKDGEQE